MKGGMGNMLKQMQEMQEKIQKSQEDFHKKEVVGESGAGLVKVTMNGKHSVISVNVDPSILSEEKDLLEDLVAAAVNDATHKIEKLQEESMSGLGKGMGLPGNFKLPF